MDKVSFETLVFNIFEYFRYKQPTEKTLGLWYFKIKHIPNEIKYYAYDYITEKDNLPRNLPKCFKEAWNQWTNENPSRRATIEETECVYCNGIGILFYFINGYGFSCRCGNCTNWEINYGENVAVIHTAQELIQLGAILT